MNVQTLALYVGAGVAIGGMTLFVLWVRVVLESAIVIFNIATSLTSIQELLRQREAAE